MVCRVALEARHASRRVPDHRLEARFYNRIPYLVICDSAHKQPRFSEELMGLRPNSRRRGGLRLWTAILVLLGYAAFQWVSEERFDLGTDRATADGAIEQAFAAQRSGVWVENQGTVERTLRDDNEGSRHQRFIVRLASGHTVLIAHNIDLAPRARIRSGDAISFRGQYEWNQQGGVVHWTHHDPRSPDRIDAGGWLDVDGELVR